MFVVKQKIFAILFALLCLFSSAQFVLNQHFCCNKLVQICFNEINVECCSTESTCHTEKKHASENCCDDKEIVVESEEFLGHSKIPVPTTNAVQLVSTLFVKGAFCVKECLNEQKFQPPPNVSSLSLKYCVFRI